MTMRAFLGALRGLTLLALAGSATAGGVEGASRLAGSEWRPTKLGERAIPHSTDAFIQFRGGGKLAGHTGCNRFSGMYRVTGDALDIGPLATTEMLCPDAVMADEAALLSVLSRVAFFRRDGVVLHLLDPDGSTIAELAQTDWD